MKIDRLIGVLSVLLQKDVVTAPQLADRFEVSRRTINRDIEELCMAGIPVCTRQGMNGGISIMDSYKMDRTLLTSKEMQEILAGLRSLDSISGNNQYGQLMEKLQIGSSDLMSGNQSILIDLSAWDKGSIAKKISLLRAAIDGNHILQFEYYSPNGESSRSIEPYYLIFRWSSWYVWGWCNTRNDFRLFKLNRMDKIMVSEKHFPKRAVQMPDLSNDTVFPGNMEIEVLFSPDCKWRLVEEYGPDSFTEQSDGRLLFSWNYTHKATLISWLLSFGSKAEIRKPTIIRNELLEIAKNLVNVYKEKVR
ncbi:MAG TPA: YafY family protein [Lachnospiraceae bacterium]|nr:YafY family protein [Lachnospiraceae bacterium]